MSETWTNVRKVLAMRLDSFGDVIMLGPALRALSATMPQARITLMASPSGALAAPLLPWVADVVVHRAVWQRVGGDTSPDAEEEGRLISRLERGGFDAAFIFTSFAQSPYPPAYVAYLAGIPLRVGQSAEWGGRVLSHLVRSRKEGAHQVDRNLHLLESVGIPPVGRQLEVAIPRRGREEADRVLAQVGVRPGDPFVAVAPGSSRQATRYPAHRYARAVGILAERTDLPIVVTGSRSEVGLAATVAAGARTAHSVAGRLTLPGLGALLERAAVLICNNSAPLHLADAVGTPLVVLYSGTERELEFVPRTSPARLVGRGTECTPCRRFECPRELECLDVEPEIVAWAAVSMMERAGERAAPERVVAHA